MIKLSSNSLQRLRQAQGLAGIAGLRIGEARSSSNQLPAELFLKVLKSYKLISSREKLCTLLTQLTQRLDMYMSTLYSTLFCSNVPEEHEI